MDKTPASVLRGAVSDVERGMITAVVVLMKTKHGTWARDHSGVKISNDEKWIEEWTKIHPHEGEG